MENKTKEIDFKNVFSKCIANKKLFFIIIPIILILACIYIYNVPRYYTTDTILAPEIENSSNSGTIGSLASSFGLDINQIKSTDAITPLLYPDLLKDNKFIFNFFNITVQTQDKKKSTNYYEYLANCQKVEPWNNFLSNKQKKQIIPDSTTNPYKISKEQNDIIERIRSSIKFSVDSKSGVITITTTDQDPVVCKTLADSIRNILKNYITTYRTSKARADVIYYKKLAREAKNEYEKARRLYGSYADSNSDIVLESFRSKQEDLENDMQLKFNAYSQLSAQLQSAIAKLQEKTPVFTTLKGAAVPIKPAGPKRLLFIITMVALGFILCIIITLRKDIKKIFI